MCHKNTFFSNRGATLNLLTYWLFQSVTDLWLSERGSVQVASSNTLLYIKHHRCVEILLCQKGNAINIGFVPTFFPLLLGLRYLHVQRWLDAFPPLRCFCDHGSILQAMELAFLHYGYGSAAKDVWLTCTCDASIGLCVLHVLWFIVELRHLQTSSQCQLHPRVLYGSSKWLPSHTLYLSF